jgi:serine/threonine protein kinase
MNLREKLEDKIYNNNMYKYKLKKYNIKNLNLIKNGGRILCRNIINQENSGIISQIKDDIKFAKSGNGFSKIDKNKKYSIIPVFDDKRNMIILGSGSFGKVFKGKLIISSLENGREDIIEEKFIAVKQILYDHKNEKYNNSVCLELLSLYKIKDKNIVDYIGYAEDIGYFFIFMEFLDGETLDKYLFKASPSEKIEITKQLLDGLNFLHNNNIYHRDIKPNNIIVTKDNENNIIIKYIDFGFSCKLNFTCIYSDHDIGTPLYLSPEFVKNISNKINDTDYYKYYDLWALGVTIYYLFANKYLFETSNNYDYDNFLINLTDEYIDSLIAENFTNVQDNIKIIIKDLLQINYQYRKLNLILE